MQRPDPFVLTTLRGSDGQLGFLMDSLLACYCFSSLTSLSACVGIRLLIHERVLINFSSLRVVYGF